MLLYSRVAARKSPKTRSRAGCTYCKAKKKKCDEFKPKCSRCQDHGRDCVYEPIRPRQRRRKLQPVNPTSLNKPLSIPIPIGANKSFRIAEKETTFGDWGMRRWHVSDSHFDRDLETPYIREPVPLTAKRMGSVVDDIYYYTPLTPDVVANNSFPVPSWIDLVSLDNVSGQEDIEDVVHHDSSILAPSPRRPSFGLLTPAPTPSPYLEFCTPAFAEFSQSPNRRALIDHFTNVISHLIVLREDEGNPFQQLVLPLSHQSPTVMNAVYALASAHLEHRGIHNSEKSIYFHNQAIQGVSHLIANGCDTNKNELLAAIILLIYYEVLVQTGQSNIVDGHLRGAMAIMNDGSPRTDPTGVFLERAFRFYDVIAALSLGTSPISHVPGNGEFAPFPPIDCRGVTAPDGNADTLLGMATSLWPIIHRLSTLAGLKKELHLAESLGDHAWAAYFRAKFDTTASAIEVALQEWPPVLSTGEAFSEDDRNLGGKKAAERRRMLSILNSATAYRHSGLVYLYRSVYGFPRSHAMVQHHTHISLTHCVGTVKNEGPMGALLWPLFVAACEAIDLADRELARHAFAGIGQRQGMMNIEQAWSIVQEVWRRADKGEDADDQREDLWRMVGQDMGITVVFG